MHDEIVLEVNIVDCDVSCLYVCISGAFSGALVVTLLLTDTLPLSYAQQQMQLLRNNAYYVCHR